MSRVYFLLAICVVATQSVTSDIERDGEAVNYSRLKRQDYRRSDVGEVDYFIYRDETDDSVRNTASGSRPYVVPKARFIAMWPNGLKVVIKDDGFTFAEFHGNLNMEIDNRENGEWSQAMRKNRNGKWVFRDKNAELKIGDTIYFWTKMIKDGKEYFQKSGVHTVKRHLVKATLDSRAGYLDENEVPVNPSTSPNEAPKVPPSKPTKEPACKSSQTLVMGVSNVCKNALIFSEEFDKKTVEDLSNWQVENKFTEEPDYPFNVYMADPPGIYTLKDRALVISPLLLEEYKYEGFIHESLDLSSRCTGQAGTTECKRIANGAYILPPVITGKMTTKNKFNFKYGRVEVRAKLPAGSWLLPEINLEPLQNIYGSHHYESGLMKIAFARGNDVFAKKLYGGPVLSDNDPYRTMLLQKKLGHDNWNRDFHNYTLIWSPDDIQLLVDGEQYGLVSPGEGFHMTAKANGVSHAGNWLTGSLMAPLDEMFYVSLGLRVGGINDFPDEPDKPWRNKGSKAMVDFYNKKEEWHSSWYDPALKVDYVRVYAL